MKNLFFTLLALLISQLVNAQCTASISPAGNINVCQGSSITLYANTGTSYSYQWQLNGANISGATDDSLVVNSAGDYRVVITAGSCVAYSNQDTVYIQPLPNVIITASPSNFVCAGDTVTFSVNACSGCTYQWLYNSLTVIGTSNTVQGTTTGAYLVQVTDAIGCTSGNLDSMFIVTTCDSVWPGDVNSDHVVDATDALDLALGYGATGSSRTGASISWMAQACSNWGSYIVAGVDMKHADCNGDGTVDASDTGAINANYGLTHPKSTAHAHNKITGQPDLFFDFTGITLHPGATVSVPVKLGSTSTPMNNILGLTAHIKISDVTLSSPQSISFASGWLGTSANTYSFRKSVSNNQIDWAYARNNHQNASGSGAIATLTFTVPSSASGQIIFSFENVKVINASGAVVSTYNVVDDTESIAPTGVINITGNGNLEIYPNPANGIFNISGGNLENADVIVTDVTGRRVYNSKLNTNNGISQVNLSQLQNGVYFINISAGNAVYNNKITVQH